MNVKIMRQFKVNLLYIITDMSEDEISEDGLESEENDDIEHFMFENNQDGVESEENDSEEGSENEDVEHVEAQLDDPNMEKAG